MYADILKRMEWTASIRKHWPLGLSYFAAFWLSMSFLGYGIALDRLGQADGKTDSAPVFDPSKIQERQGKVSWSHVPWPHTPGVHFKLEGSDVTYYLPANFVPKEDGWREMARSLKPGIHVGVKNYVEGGTSGDGLLVMELRLNPGTPFPREIVSMSQAIEIFSKGGGKFVVSGFIWKFAGFLLLPLLIAGHIGYRKGWLKRWLRANPRASAST